MIRLAVAAILAASLWAAPALAHKLKVFATAEGAAIAGSAYFAGGGKAAGIEGLVQAPDGSRVVTFHTDDQGGFRFPVTARQDYAISVDSGDGHVAHTIVAAAELPASLPDGMAAPLAVVKTPARADSSAALDVEAAVARQIGPLRQQIDAMEERARFSDIMGGIGTIFGVFGIAAWIAARRGRKP